MQVNNGFKEIVYVKPEQSLGLNTQMIGRGYRKPPQSINIAASLNKNSIRIMDGLIIIGWINKLVTDRYAAQACYGNHGLFKFETYKECRDYIMSEYKSNKLECTINNIKKTRNLPNAKH